MRPYPKTTSSWSRIASILFVLLSLIVVPFLFFGKSIELFSVELFDKNGSENLYAMIGGILLAADPILPTPSSIIATQMGTKLGFAKAAFVNSSALLFACFFGYYLGIAGRAALRFWKYDLPNDFVKWVQRYGLIAVLICRPVPVLSEASLIVAGSAGVKKTSLFLWTGLAQIALGISYAFAGSAGDMTSPLNRFILFSGHIGIPLIGAIIVAIIIKRNKKATPLT